MQTGHIAPETGKRGGGPSVWLIRQGWSFLLGSFHSWCTLFCLEYAREDFSRVPDGVNVLFIISERGWECKAQMRKFSDDIRAVAEGEKTYGKRFNDGQRI